MKTSTKIVLTLTLEEAEQLSTFLNSSCINYDTKSRTGRATMRSVYAMWSSQASDLWLKVHRATKAFKAEQKGV